MIFKLTGQILQASPVQSGVSQSSGNQWMSQEYLMQHSFDQQHPKYMSFRVFGQQKIAQLNLQPGQWVTLSLDVNAREYNGRWYNEILAFKVEYPAMPQQPMPMQGGVQQMPMQQAMPPQMPPQAMPAQPMMQAGMQAPMQQQPMQQQMPPQAMPPQSPMPQQMPPQAQPMAQPTGQQQVQAPPQQGGLPF